MMSMAYLAFIVADELSLSGLMAGVCVSMCLYVYMSEWVSECDS